MIDEAKILEVVEGLKKQPQELLFESPDELAEIAWAYCKILQRDCIKNDNNFKVGPYSMSWQADIWGFGENIRHVIKANRRKGWRGKCKLLDVVADIIETPEYGRGREAFVMLLEGYAQKQYNDVLGKYILDPDICGHVVNALYKQRCFDYREQARELLKTNPETWIKRSIKRYLEYSK